MRDVEGKVAFVTGGNSGIGLGIARAFVNAGMKVVITYLSEKHLGSALNSLQSAGSRVHAIRVDVTDRAAMVAAAEEAVRVFGRVHVLVNNAGVGPQIPLSSATFDDWDWCMNVNVNGVFNGIRSFLPHLKEHGEGGHIVTTSSILGGLIVGPYWGVYSTTKFAVVGMMEALRSELAGSNIGVSVFCPAGVTSNIGASDRNRPTAFAQVGAPDSGQLARIQEFAKAIRTAIFTNGGAQPMMDPLEAGECVLNGIRNNDLYIISHPEYEQIIRDRSDALLASIPDIKHTPPPVRAAVARVWRNPIYTSEFGRKMRARDGALEPAEPDH